MVGRLSLCLLLLLASTRVLASDEPCFHGYGWLSPFKLGRLAGFGWLPPFGKKGKNGVDPAVAEAQRKQAEELEKAVDQLIQKLTASHRGPKELLPGEKHMHGSAEKEREAFIAMVKRVLSAQVQFSKADGTPKARVQHAQPIGGGILTEVEILDGIPEDLRQGIFANAPGKKLVGLSRFSHGMGNRKIPGFLRWIFGDRDIPDQIPDVLGYGLKILDADPAAGGSSPIKTMDLTFTNSKSGFAADPTKFVDFVEVQAETNLIKKAAKVLWWAVRQPRAVYRLADSLLRSRNNVIDQNYGSGHPYAVGKEPVRFSVSPYGEVLFPTSLRQRISDPKYLGTDLKDRIKYGGVPMVLKVRRLKRDLTPEKRQKLVEDGLAIWDDSNSEEVPVAIIHLMANGIDAETTAITEKLGWNPENYFAGHEPAGRMGRGRPWGYLASQLGRWFGTPAGNPTNLENGQAFQPELQQLVKKYKELKAGLPAVAR